MPSLCEPSGLVGEIRGDVGRCGEMWGDVGEMWGDVGSSTGLRGWGETGRDGEVGAEVCRRIDRGRHC